MKPEIRALAALSSILAMLACTDAEAPPPAGPTASATGVFVDSEVFGLRYVGPNHTGWTNELGEYDYEPGDQVCFFLGDIPLGCAEGRGVVTPIDLAEGDEGRANNIVRFLLSLDADGNPDNGIDVADVMTTPADAAIDFDQDGTAFGADMGVLDFVDDQGHDGDLVSEMEAEDHLSESLEESDYYAQVIVGHWVIAVFTEGFLLQTEAPNFPESDIASRQVEADDENVAFDYAVRGESCTAYASHITNSPDDFGDALNRQMWGQAECSADYFMVAHSVSPQSVFSDEDLESQWFTQVTFPDTQNNPFDVTLDWRPAELFSVQGIAGNDESITAEGRVQFTVVGEGPGEGGVCVFDGQMSTNRWVVGGSVDCTLGGAGIFWMQNGMYVD